MYFLSKELFFPPVSQANPDGILAIGGDLSPKRLLLAYKSGIFPCLNKGNPFIGGRPIPEWSCF
jgi:leucyl/phenylalanyl-tRNA--protein transferase